MSRRINQVLSYCQVRVLNVQTRRIPLNIRAASYACQNFHTTKESWLLYGECAKWWYPMHLALRRVRDSNPRTPCGVVSFQDWCNKPDSANSPYKTTLTCETWTHPHPFNWAALPAMLTISNRFMLQHKTARLRFVVTKGLEPPLSCDPVYQTGDSANSSTSLY